MAKRERNYAWYLKPKNKAVNDSIGTEVLARLGEDDYFGERVCADGVSRNLWQCDQQIIAAIIAKYKLSKDFEIFRKEGKGAIANVSFIFARRRKTRTQKAPVH